MENIDLYINKFVFTEEDTIPDLSEVSPLVRRRMMRVDKISVYTMLHTFDESVEEIIFASQQGEMTRLDKIIEQYTNYGESSPSDFAASVHNYVPGWFSLYKKSNVPYYAISAGENSVSAALVKAIISDKNNVMITCSDKKSVSAIVSKNDGTDKVEFIPDVKREVLEDEYDRFIKFLTGAEDCFETPFGLFKRCGK